MFGIRLQRARKAAGLSLRALGEKAGVSHAAIKKYEDDLSLPSSDVLIQLSRVLDVRTEYFFRPTLVTLEGIEYRKHHSLPKKQLSAITSEVMDQIERRIELEALFPRPPIRRFVTPRALPDRIAQIDQIEIAAERLRDAWDLGFDPIPDLIGLLEIHGIRVFMIDADEGMRFDGLAARVDGTPIVAVGRRWPGDRQRFTLAHELGHLLLEGRLANNLDEEAACNRFAAAFLFPRASLLCELGPHRSAIELRELGILKREFGLSMAGILHRAFENGIVSATYRNQQVRLFKRNGWNLQEPGCTYPSEKTHLFEQLVFHALAEDYIGESKAAELLKLPLVKFRNLRALECNHAGDQ
jgi:Zn-dependent peptidase ImmA (M78 family)/DNA-binding XRE family transcriptional regulator